jgi:two-component system chemotaxis response regulator CheB
MRKARVLIIEDSAVMREQLRHIIRADPRLEVAAAVESAEDALRIIHQAAPDVISLDIRLPGMNGFEATRRIMSERPTPVVVVSASVESEELKITLNALAAGALAVVEKPAGSTREEYESSAQHLCTQLAIMSQVKVVRQHGRLDLPVPPANRAPAAGRGPYGALGVVASTGGPNALAAVLGGLDSGFPLPVFVVQHMAPGFFEGFADWLAGVSPLPVETVASQTLTLPGRVYLAAAGRHLRADRRCVRADAGRPVCAQRPSGTVLFQSMAENFGPQALGVLLTGMGEDGALGLLDLRKAGGYTIAEDESTAVVYGMPGAAARLGAVCESLPLPAIAPRIRDLVSAAAGGL